MVETIEQAASEEASEAPEPSFIANILRNRVVQIGIGIVLALIIFLIILGFMSRFSKGKHGEESDKPISSEHLKYVPVFEKLTLIDAAQIREALSFENIPFKSEKDGRVINISIGKKWADEARVKMAQLGLPEGGVVGFEIFDKSQSMGATEYDKRIQYVRAVSGELSRLISHMKGIASARVRIVIPEQKPFGDRIQGSASVLLNLKSKQNISDKQIKGIMHLVASSVEDIKPEDVTVVDNSGAILSDRVKLSFTDKRQAVLFDLLSSHDDEKKSPLEILLRFKDQLKKNFENEYTQKVKEVLATLYPVGSYLVFTNVELKESEKESTPFVLGKADIAILLDSGNRDVKLTSQLKSLTISLVGSAIGYQEGRDTLVVEKGPFVNIESDAQGTLFRSAGHSLNKEHGQKQQQSFFFKYVYGFILVSLIFIFIILRSSRSQKTTINESVQVFEEDTEAGSQSEAKTKFQNYVQNNESLIIEKLTSWIRGEA
ncbi:MAG: flagellar basal-body MS-ring/collar protein FliF [Candidatus Margulisiibacteriota bacterium]